jgi:hypothetical protein
MESLAHECGQRVLPHFASYNPHEIKASQDAALKYSPQKARQQSHDQARHTTDGNDKLPFTKHDSSDN